MHGQRNIKSKTSNLTELSGLQKYFWFALLVTEAG